SHLVRLHPHHTSRRNANRLVFPCHTCGKTSKASLPLMLRCWLTGWRLISRLGHEQHQREVEEEGRKRPCSSFNLADAALNFLRASFTASTRFSYSSMPPMTTTPFSKWP